MVIWAFRRLQILDYPNPRSLHDRPVVRGGGGAVFLGTVAGLMVALPFFDKQAIGVLVVATGFATIGLIEDLRGIPALKRLTLHFVVAAAGLPWLLEGLSGPALWQLTFGAGVLAWLVAYANGFNFMDGINGISVAQATVAGSYWAITGIVEDVAFLALGGLLTAAAALAFLPFNFPHARVFLGDVGSYFLGSWVAGLCVVGLRAGLPAEAVVAPLSLYLVDTGSTIVKRLRQREELHAPHRRHSYQQLVQHGWSHMATTGAVTLFLLALSGLGALSLAGGFVLRMVAMIAGATVLIGYVALPRLVKSESMSDHAR